MNVLDRRALALFSVFSAFLTGCNKETSQDQYHDPDYVRKYGFGSIAENDWNIISSFKNKNGLSVTTDTDTKKDKKETTHTDTIDYEKLWKSTLSVLGTAKFSLLDKNVNIKISRAHSIKEALSINISANEESEENCREKEKILVDRTLSMYQKRR